MKQLLCVLILVTTAAAVRPSRYQPGVLVHAMGGGRAVGSSGGHCYTLVVRVANIGYVAQQCPNFYWNSFMPYEFVEGGPVRVRFEKDKLVVLRPNGKELKANITRRVRWDLYQEESRIPTVDSARGTGELTF